MLLQVHYTCVELQGIAKKLYHLPQCTPVFIAETFDIHVAQLTGTNKLSNKVSVVSVSTKLLTSILIMPNKKAMRTYDQYLAVKCTWKYFM